ncbi:MAG: putative flap endonuclease-1-like 5' DNA nuclease [Saprospiraceae bacterium]|jgi:predicted flap endonuclease-1-like 5' DNA nuclease
MSLTKQFSKTKPVCKVTFTLPSEAIMTGDQVVVLGEFNNWDRTKGLPMKATKKGYTAALELEAGRDYQFRYLIDNEKWENDWAADSYVPNPYGVDNSVVVVSEVKTVTKAAPKKTTTKATTTAKVAAPKKTVTKKAVEAKADDLKKIEGVGVKIASLLNAAGIVTFADLGKAKQTTLKEILANAGTRFQMHDPKTWPKQAKLAAKGDWATLKTLQDELNGGK